MFMFGMLKVLFGGSEEGAGKVNGEVVMALEMAVEKNDTAVIDKAANLRNQLRRNGYSLSRAEKVRIVKALNKAKVTAIMGGTPESYSVFRNLDSISSDVVQLL